MKSLNAVLRTVLISGGITAAMFLGSLLPGGPLVGQAEARVGRPMTPVSVAGVARRTTRRVVRRSAIYVATLPPACTTVTINGAVLQVVDSIEPGLVSINRGTDDGVERGFTFEIYSGNQYKGQVRVESVQKNICTAIVLRTHSGAAISAGDAAATRI